MSWSSSAKAPGLWRTARGKMACAPWAKAAGKRSRPVSRPWTRSCALSQYRESRMPRFAYTGRDRAGADRQGHADAPTRRDAIRLLAGRGLQVANLAETSAAGLTRVEA